MKEFEDTFGKISRLTREILISEKIDGSRGLVEITDEGEFLIGSRNRYLTPEADNFGFCRWCLDRKDDLMKLGVGKHFGEFFGGSVQRGYGIKEKKFALFNISRWIKKESDRWNDKQEIVPECLHIVPLLFRGMFNTGSIDLVLEDLKQHGSYAVDGFNDPEGIVIYLTSAGIMLKKTIKDDEQPKGLVK